MMDTRRDKDGIPRGASEMAAGWRETAMGGKSLNILSSSNGIYAARHPAHDGVIVIHHGQHFFLALLQL